MKKVLFLALIWFNLGAISAFSQEICDNGIDDDNDGFIDCYDPDCSNNNACSGYFGNDANCQAIPPAFPQFSMRVDWSSPNGTANHLNRVSIGDLDADGIPEVVSTNVESDRIYILNGNGGTIKRQLAVNYRLEREASIANLDGDNCAEIFTFGRENGNWTVFAYDCNLNQIWKRRASGNPVTLGLADFDGDGLVELYYRDEILDAHTGTRIVRSTDFNDIVGEPVAVDMDPLNSGDPDLELIAGCIIFDVNLGARTADSGSLTERSRVNNFHNRKEFSSTSVADYNQDGFLDIIASGSAGSKDANTTVFFWDVQNNIVRTFSDPDPSIIVALSCSGGGAAARYANGWQNGTGRLNIADLDGNGQLNASFVSGKFLYALDENFDLFWRVVINEETSGYTGSTLFDFNGDGQAEVVYRDERFLYIINGNTGAVYTQQTCVARTAVEYPIVADLDADGASELCVTCGFDDALAAANFCNLGYSTNSHVRAFESAGEPWVPARRVWNQHAYFNVNVNDDLTIPIQQQKHHLVWSLGTCTVGPNRPLNSFLIQAPYLDTNGCPTYPAPDLRFVDNSLIVNPPTCPEQDFTISFQMENIGDISVSGDFPISFYSGDPRLAGATLLNTITVTLNTLNPGTQFSVNNATVTGTGSAFTLFIVLNDDGTTIPTPIAPNTTILECDYTNNVLSSPVVPGPVSLTALMVQENIKCDPTSPDNGTVRAFIPGAGGSENTTDYDFFWYNSGQPVAGPADFTGPIYSGLAGGDYTVFAIHKTANCNSDTVTLTLTEIVPDPADNAVIVLENPYDNCKNPNGKLRVVVNGGASPIGDYTYEWYEGPIVLSGPKVSVSHIATSLIPLTYSVLVTNKATGCESIATFDLPDDSVKPVPDIVTTDILCSSSNSGSAAATADGGQVAGYTFDWYNGNTIKPSPDFTGDTYSNLAAGSYTLVVTKNSQQCPSDPVTITITQTIAPTVTASTITHQTSCDPAQPNGSVIADIGAQTGLTFEWFTGQNTLPANLIAGATTATLDNLAPGIYTVRVTDPVTGCTATAEATVNFAVVTPSIIIGAIADMTNCTTPNGSITVNVTLDTPADYTFSWYDGGAVKATPDYPDTDNVLENLPPGDYTVRAVHNTKNCETPAITATVVDNTPIIQITVDDNITVLPTDCTTPDGEMTATISAPGNTAGFDIEWFFGQAPFGDPILTQTVANNGTSVASNLFTGIYTVFATNLDNGCVASAEFYLPFGDAQELLFIAKTNVLNCSPSDQGQLTVELVPTNLPGFVESDYILEIYDGPTENDPVIETINGVNGVVQYSSSNTLEPGFYTVVAISNNPITLGCKSNPVLVEIEQIVTLPAIVATQIDANMNCTGAIATGRIELEIDGGANPADYSYSWFEGPTTASPVLGTATTGTTAGSGEIAQDLPPGQYTVEVTKTSGTSLGCTSVATYTIFDNPPVMSIADTDIQIDQLTRCDVNDALVTILSVTENSTAQPFGNYSFEWFDVNLNPLPGTNVFTPPVAGDYFVRATNIVSNCATGLKGFTVMDMTIGTTGVDLVSFIDPTQCLKPMNVDGELAVIGTGGASSYSYNWYAGSTASGPVINTTATLSNIVVPGGQPDVTFTVEVINDDNGCVVTDTYTLPVEIAPITLAASAASLTFCATDNGAVFGTVTSGNSNDYTYNWYIGNTVQAVPDATGKDVINLPAGEYTVVAVDNVDAFCQTLPQTVEVLDERIFPVPTATPLSPVTNCDPAKQNGAAGVSVNGDVINYTFDWYAGAVVTGVPFYTGAQANSLAAGQYTIEARDIVTGCTGTTQVTIVDAPTPVPLPQIEIVSQVTSCVFDNGILAASVNGNTKDYIFNWYDGSTVNATPDFVGERYDSLSAGTYTVTATSRITGCVSAPVSETIIEDPAYPDFEFKIESASCDQDNGYVTLFLTTNVDVGTIEWDYNGTIIVGPNLENAQAGIYSVTVTSQLGCATTKEVEIKTDIHPFNYISRNGDDKNDRFFVECIDEFPNNVVKIYNRAGTLVYEAPGYDNIDIFFDGRANRGITALGDNLPDGTYFYVIDKRDGSKHLAGYLEIVN